jgi:hypothetical protein
MAPVLDGQFCSPFFHLFLALLHDPIVRDTQTVATRLPATLDAINGVHWLRSEEATQRPQQ